jgi:spermidine synthase
MDKAESFRLRFAHIVLALSMLVTGACGMIYEYTLGILGNNLMGSSREQIFVIIGLMMFAMGIGAALQQRLGRHLLDKFLGIEILLGFLGGVSTLVIFTTFAYTESFHLVMYTFALAIGVLIGFEVPLLIRINAEYKRRLETNLSSILSMDYVGSLLGALLFVYVFLARFSVERISLLLGLVNTLLALVGIIYFWPFVHRKYALMGASWLSLIVLFAVGWKSEGWMVRLEQRCFADPIVHTETTKYQHVVLTQRRQRTRLYIDGHLQFSSEDEKIYHELLVHVPMRVALQRENILVLGGGDGLALREVLRYGDVQNVTLVDIDPGMIRLASENPEMIRLNRAAFHDARVTTRISDGIESGEKVTLTARGHADVSRDGREYSLASVHVYTIDADLFLRKVNEQYDVVIIDFPDPRSVELAKLYSVEFFRAVRQHLSPGGAVAVQSTSPIRAQLVFSCIGETLAAAGFQRLPYHDHVPSFGEWGWHLAWSGEPSDVEMRAQLAKRDRLPVPTDYVTPEVINAAFVFGKNVLHTNEEIHANTKLRPIVLAYYERGFR